MAGGLTTLSDAVAALAPLLGATGLGGTLIAYFAFRTEQAKGRRGEPDKASGLIGISALLADSESVTKLSISLSQVALAADKIALLTEENRGDLRDAIARGMKLATEGIEEVRALRHAIEDMKRGR